MNKTIKKELEELCVDIEVGNIDDGELFKLWKGAVNKLLDKAYEQGRKDERKEWNNLEKEVYESLTSNKNDT